MKTRVFVVFLAFRSSAGRGPKIVCLLLGACVIFGPKIRMRVTHGTETVSVTFFGPFFRYRHALHHDRKEAALLSTKNFSGVTNGVQLWVVGAVCQLLECVSWQTLAMIMVT